MIKNAHLFLQIQNFKNKKKEIVISLMGRVGREAKKILCALFFKLIFLLALSITFYLQ